MTKLDDRTPPVALSDRHTQALAAALDRDPVVAVRLFGSQASGRAGPLADVDLGVWLRPEAAVGLRMELELAGAAREALATDEVDLVVLNQASPLLRHRALAARTLVLDRDPKQRLRLEARALVEYLDTAPLRDELGRGLSSRLAEDTFGRS